MNRRLIDGYSWRMADVYAAVVDRILINLARHFQFIQEGSPVPGAWDYQIRKLAEMGQVTRESEAIILEMLGGADEALQGMLEAVIKDSLKDAEEPLKKAAERGLMLGEGFLPPELAPNQMQAFKYYYNQSADKLNLVNTVMLESTEEAYRATVADIATKISTTQGILNTATGEIITGVESFNKIQRDAVRRMVDNGLTGFIDHGGHHWSPEAYVAMDMRTTMTNTGRESVWEQSEEVGVELYQVSWHDGARPLCYPWQGKVISRNGWRGEVTDGDGNTVTVHAEDEIESFKYGGGLFGVNCGHYPIPFIAGFSRIRPPRQDEEENAKEYAESQQQRALERKLREEKRELEVMKAQGASKEEIEAQKTRVRGASADVQEFCDKTGRARQRQRETAPINASFPDGYKQTYYEQGIKRRDPNKQDNDFTKTPQVEAQIGQPIPTAFERSDIEKAADSYGIARLKVAELPERLSEHEVISRVGGGDRTQGSCASVALAYSGNKEGLDVLDFRGGESRAFFASPGTAKMLAELEGVEGIVIDDGYMFTSAHKLLKQVEEGKEYFFTAGRHAAVVRRTEDMLEYLELQTQNDNGWKELNDSVLGWRFGCTKREKKPYDVLIDLEKLQGNLSFRRILEFINTEEGLQLKGVGGYAK